MTTKAKVIDPERAALWREVFGTDEVPVLSHVPSYATLPGFDLPKLVYLLDLAAVTPEQRQKLCEQTAERFGLTAVEVDAGLARFGMPILAEDVMVSSDDIGLILAMVDDDDFEEGISYWDGGGVR